VVQLIEVFFFMIHTLWFDLHDLARPTFILNLPGLCKDAQVSANYFFIIYINAFIEFTNLIVLVA